MSRSLHRLSMLLPVQYLGNEYSHSRRIESSPEFFSHCPWTSRSQQQSPLFFMKDGHVIKKQNNVF